MIQNDHQLKVTRERISKIQDELLRAVTADNPAMTEMYTAALESTLHDLQGQVYQYLAGNNAPTEDEGIE